MEKVRFPNKEGLKLEGIIDKPDKGGDIGIIICHGFTGGKDRNSIPELAKKLGEEFLVLRFDFSGNWDSEGNFEDRTYAKYVDDLGSAIDFMAARVKKVCVIGFSMGGAVALLQAVKSDKTDFLVLAAPALQKFKSDRLNAADKKGFVEFVDSWGRKRRLNKGYFEDRTSYDFGEEAKKLKIPVLMIIGDKDNVISIPKCREVYEKVSSPKKFVSIKNENHVFHNKAPDEMVSSIASFVKDFGN